MKRSQRYVNFELYRQMIMNGEDLGAGRGLFPDTIPVFAGRGREKTCKI